jgi:hypothetical protein
MSKKEVRKIDVRDEHNDFETFIPVGILEGEASGPTLTVVAGVHGSEYAALEGVHRFWESLDETAIAGTVNVVLAADVTAAAHHQHYTNPVDGKNLNRVWPGKEDGTLTEVITHTITQEFVHGADAVVDCHGGEFDEFIDLFTITHSSGDEELDRRTEAFAMDLGLPFVEVTDAHGEVLGSGTGAAEAVKSGRPAVTLETGGRGEMNERHIDATYVALRNALRHLDMVDGEPALFAGEPIKIDHGILLSSDHQGLYDPVAEIGGWIEEGDDFAVVRDFDGTELQRIRAPESGVVLDVVHGRLIREDGFVGKIGVLPRQVE